MPPITTAHHALDYERRLAHIEPNVTYLMSLYLHPHITPEIVRDAKRAGICGIKSYPHGVTTNSDSGVMSYEAFYPVFEEMERQDLVLNIHGELPSSANNNVTVLSAEEAFLPTLFDLHRRFPKLRIVLEHCTSAAAIEAVKRCGDTVAATITAHHLFITVDDWAGDPHNFCKPVAKLPSDRVALLQAVASGNSKFFFGSDSAPHPAVSKRADRFAAGVFTQPYAVGLVVEALELGVERGVLQPEDVTKENLQGFLANNGRKFYALPVDGAESIVLRKSGVEIQDTFCNEKHDIEVVPFRRGKLTWKVEWL